MNLRALAAILATAVLAGCGAVSHVTGTAAGPVASPPSCHAQYETWKHGPAKAAAGKLKSALRAVQAQGTADDLPGMARALRRTGHAARALAAMPPPRCADPAGDYGKMLALIRAAGDNARAARGLGALLLAEVPLKKIPAVEKQLGAELDRTVGKNR